MNTRRHADFWTAPEGQSFLHSHLPIVYHLDRITNWAVFGTITFDNPALRSSTDLSRIHQHLYGLLNGLAARFKVRTRRLVFFYSIEGDGVVRHRHAHILLADDGLETQTPVRLAEVLAELADGYELGNCRFEPFDPRKDGVAYVAKIDLVPSVGGRPVRLEPQTCESTGLRKRIQHLDSDSDGVRESTQADTISESSGANPAPFSLKGHL